MGSVNKSGETKTIVDGYPIEYSINYIYCDRCGSFNIAPTIALENYVAIALVLLGTVIAVYYVIRHAVETKPDFGIFLLMCGAVFVMVPVLIFFIFSLHSGHLCRKCGNTHITNQDVLNYAQQDLDSLLDVPENMIHRHK